MHGDGISKIAIKHKHMLQLVEELWRRLTHIGVAAGILACSPFNGKYLVAA